MRIWILIRNAHFELCSVHTREVIAIFELRSVHTRVRIWDFAFQREKNVWVPCQSNMHGVRISCASVHRQCSVYRRKWLEGHLAPPPNHDLEVRAFIRWLRCVICEMRNRKTPLDCHLKCAFQITHRDVIWRTHGPNYRLSNFNSKCAFRIKIQHICTLSSCENSLSVPGRTMWTRAPSRKTEHVNTLFRTFYLGHFHM